jgi:hypothetical protein
MRRWFHVLGVIGVLSLVSGQGALAATTATFTWTLTIPESPLWATVRPDCTFVVESGAATAECSARVLMTQPTATTDGWQLQLWVSGLVDPRSGSTLPAGAVSVAGIEPVALREGQAIDAVGGHMSAATTSLRRWIPRGRWWLRNRATATGRTRCRCASRSPFRR